MPATEKIYEGSGIVVKAVVPQEYTDKLKSVTFKFFQDGKAPATDELCEDSEFVKDYTASDVGNGDEEDAVDGHDVIVHRVNAPKVPDDKDSYVLDYHLFYEVENRDGKIEKNQQLSVQQFQVFPRRARLKVIWDKDDEPFHNFKFRVMQNGEQAGGVLHTFSHDTENVDGETIPAGSAEFNLGLSAGFQIAQNSPWVILKETKDPQKKRSVEIRGDLAFKAVFLNPTAKGTIEQIVNYDIEDKGQTGVGPEVVVEVGIDPQDESAREIGNAKHEVHFRVTFGPEEGQPVAKSKRDDPDHPTKVVKADDADTVTITEKKPKLLYEGKVELVNGFGRFKVCLGLAGGDTCKVEIAGSEKFLTDDTVEPDQQLAFENWRVIHYELMVPDTLHGSALDASSLNLKQDALKQLDDLSRKAFVDFLHEDTRIFDALGQADHGTLGPKGFFDVASGEGGPAYVLSGRNWRKVPKEQFRAEKQPSRTLYVSLCDRMLKWREDTDDEKAGTKDFSGTLTEATGVVDPQERFGGLFMPFSGHDAGDCVTDVVWTADVSKDDSVCKYTPVLTVEEIRYEYPVIDELVIELAFPSQTGVILTELLFSRDPETDRFTSELDDGNNARVKDFVNAILSNRPGLAAADGKVAAQVSCSEGSEHDESKCIANAKAKLQESFDAAAKPFSFHPALDADDAPRTGSLSMEEITDRNASTMYEWHFSLPERLSDGSLGPGAFIGPEKSKTKCPVKLEFSFRPHESSYGEIDGKLLAWACTAPDGKTQLPRLILQSFAANSDAAGLEHGHGGEGKPGDCLEEADTLCERCLEFVRGRNLSSV